MVPISALEVHLTGGAPIWLELAGPAAIVVAAVTGAAFAARYASRNVVRELAAADRRLRQELHHDQILREREATRRTLDEVTNIATDGMDALVDYAAQIYTTEERVKECERVSGGSLEQAEAEEALDKAIGETTAKMDGSHAAVRKIRPAHVRLQLRFPEDHPVCQGYAALLEAIKASEINERGHGPEPRTAQELQHAQGVREEIPHQLNLFLAAARAWIEEVMEVGAFRPNRLNER